jgi:hypothetical protein
VRTWNSSPARTSPSGQLGGLFNAGYRGYLVPLALDEPQMRRHVTDNDIDLGVSRVAVTDDGPTAFALIGRRGHEAWVGGMGTLRGVAAAAPENPVRLSNFPLGETVAAAITELSAPDLIQNEMALRLRS